MGEGADMTGARRTLGSWVPRGAVRTAILRWALAGTVLCGGLVLLVMQGPRLLSRLDLFRVERVEVIGTRYLSPHQVLALSGITDSSSVFDEPRVWESALLADPMVAEATVEREVPNTLIIRVREVEPVAFVRTPILRPVAAGGQVLPIEPGTGEVDYPIVLAESQVGPDGFLGDSTAIELVGVLDNLRRLAPSTLVRVSAIAPARDGYRLILRDPARGEVLLPRDYTALGIEQLQLVLADLAAKRELPRLRRIDIRFRDQVVVSLTSS